MRVLERFEVQYSGRLDGDRLPTQPTASEAASAGDEQVVVRGHAVRMPLAVARRLLQERTGTGAEPLGYGGLGVDCVRVTSAELQRSLQALVAARAATEIAQPRAARLLDGAARFAELAQLSYVSAFSIEATTGALLASPRVEVATKGSHLTVRPELAGDTCALDLTLRCTDLVQPLASAARLVAPGTPPVHIQLPVFFRQELRARPRLRAGEALCVACPGAPERAEVVLWIVECEPRAAARPGA